MKKVLIHSLFLVGLLLSCGPQNVPYVDPSKQTEGIPGTFSGATVDQQYWQYMMESELFFFRKNVTLVTSIENTNLTIKCDNGKIEETDGRDYTAFYNVIGDLSDKGKLTLEHYYKESQYDPTTQTMTYFGDYKKMILEVFPEELVDIGLPPIISYNYVHFDEVSKSYKATNAKGQYRYDYGGEGEVEVRTYDIYNVDVKFNEGLLVYVRFEHNQQGDAYSLDCSAYGATSVTLPVVN